ISPDGKRMAAVVWNGSRRELWIYGLERETSTLLTGDGQLTGGSLAWTPDGTRLVYPASIAAETRLLWRAADGSGPEEPLITSQTSLLSPEGGSLSPDGSWLAFVQRHPKTGDDIWRLRIDGDRKPEPFLVTQAGERQPVISPDGRRISSLLRESRSFHGYVQPFPGPGPRIQVSTESFPATSGGRTLLGLINLFTAWSVDGKELFYLCGRKVMAVEIQTHPELRAGNPRVL